MSDLLEQATRALREAGAPAPASLGRARARVRASASSERRRSRALVLALPLAAALLGTSAWAGGRLHDLPAAIRALIDRGAPSEREATRGPSATIAPVAAPIPVATSIPVASSIPVPSSIPVAAPIPVPTSILAPAEAPPPRAPVLRAPKARPASAAPAPPAAEPDPQAADLALYQVAHRLHFATRDHAAALVAYGAYLEAHPAGSFAPEARYNRALCLAELGRAAEARRALAPFAEGRAGGYRRPEARALAEALGEDAP